MNAADLPSVPPPVLPLVLPPLVPGETPSWAPFLVLPREERAKAPRSMESRDGIGDRLRVAAFAEIQAYYAFIWAADTFADAPPALRQNWRGLALAEERHLGWLLKRMAELGIDVRERGVSDWLWVSLQRCASAKEFAVFIASAEERGRVAGVKFSEALRQVDPTSAEIFGRIAEEEIEHIRLAEKFYPDDARAQLAANASRSHAVPTPPRSEPTPPTGA